MNLQDLILMREPMSSHMTDVINVIQSMMTMTTWTGMRLTLMTKEVLPKRLLTLISIKRLRIMAKKSEEVPQGLMTMTLESHLLNSIEVHQVTETL